MLILLSPSKKLDPRSPITAEYSEPALIDKTAQLAKTLKGFNPNSIAKLMNVSPSIATLTHQRFQNFSLPLNPKNAHPALYFFSGEAFQYLDCATLDQGDVDFAQKHLRILSGLYGFLRPLDLISAYRLEMGLRFQPKKGQKNLYDFWQDSVTELLNKELHATAPENRLVIDLTSPEYGRVVHKKKCDGRIITASFLQKRNGALKSPSWGIKPLRGLVARHLIQQKSVTIEALKSFNAKGYQFSQERSDAQKAVFIKE